MMKYQVLARKWRPKHFFEVVGQTHITRALKGAIANNRIGHAYLFVGTRGVGKTTLARLFSRAIRCEKREEDLSPCGKCPPCVDGLESNSLNMIEIDGASNNSVENVREIIGNVSYLPSVGKYKIYIIDEVHMLSTSAFNALLKTLEDPPEHVIFLLATTEPHKLIDTVISRCQRFDLKELHQRELEDYLIKILKTEKIDVESSQVVTKIAELGNGSVRDALTHLDQVLALSEGKLITNEIVSYAFGLVSEEHVLLLTQYLVDGNHRALSKLYLNLLNEFISAKNILKAIIENLYVQIAKKGSTDPEYFFLYENLVRESEWIFKGLLPEKTLEILLLKLALRKQFFLPSANVMPVEEKLPETNPAVVSALPPKKMVAREDLSWDLFLLHLQKILPSTFTNLEQGSLIHPPEIKDEILIIEIGFNKKTINFYEYLIDPEVFNNLKNKLSEYYNVEVKKVQCTFKILDESETFVSTVMLNEKKEQELEKIRLASFLNTASILDAEKIFNSKVDKVNLDKKEN